MKQLSIKASCFLLLILAVVSSCSKDPVGKPQPGSGQQQSAKELRLALNESYLPLSKVDSAVAIWTTNGTTQSVRLQAGDGVLKTSLANFTYQGTGTLTVQLFTQLKVDGQPLQWEYSAYYQLYRNDAVLLTGPANITDPEWKPRVIFNYDNFMGSRFRAFIALRPDDPYFQLKGVEPVYAKKIEIKRSFHDKASGQLIFSRGWVCEQARCLDQTTWSMVDRSHFLNLDEQLAGRQWNQFRVEAYFHLNSTPASVIGFALVGDKIQ
jgi:hypothetical protein